MNQTSGKEEPAKGNRGNELFEQANREYDARRYAEALELFEDALAHGITNEVVYNNKGAALDALGRNSEAVDCYRKATSLNPSYELAWHNMGNSLFIQESYDLAARAYTKASVLNPKRQENWSGLAAAYTKLGRRKKASLVVEELSKFAEDDPSVLLLQTDLFLDAELHEQAILACRKYISKKPEAVEGYARLGNAEHEMGDYAKAIESFEHALKLSPLDKETWNNLGYTCFCAGQLEKALECFDRAIGIDPDYKHAWYNRGYALHGADRLEEAVESYRKAIRIDPYDRVLWNNFGNALYNLGMFAESIPKFVEAIGIDADYEIAWNNIGNALEKLGAHAEAIPYHDRSLEISPDFDYALYAKGICKAMTGDPETGYDLVLESLDLNPSYDEAWKARSTIAGQLGRWDEALVSIEEALTINPEFDQGWTQRGEILLAIGDPEASQASFEMALLCLEGVRPNSIGGLSALVRRGEVLARLGRFDEALANLETAAVSGRMDFASIPKSLELRRFLSKWDLPRAVRDVAEKSADLNVRIAYAGFLLDTNDWASAERILSGLSKKEDGSDNRAVSLLMLRAKAVAGDMASVSKMLGSNHQLDRDHLAGRIQGEALEAKGDLKGAEDVYSRTMRANPSDSALALAIARVRLKAKRYKEAIAAADIALGIDPRDWEPHRLKVEAYQGLGQKEKAEEELSRAKSKLARIGLRLEDSFSGVGA